MIFNILMNTLNGNIYFVFNTMENKNSTFLGSLRLILLFSFSDSGLVSTGTNIVSSNTDPSSCTNHVIIIPFFSFCFHTVRKLSNKTNSPQFGLFREWDQICRPTFFIFFFKRERESSVIFFLSFWGNDNSVLPPYPCLLTKLFFNHKDPTNLGFLYLFLCWGEDVRVCFL